MGKDLEHITRRSKTNPQYPQRSYSLRDFSNATINSVNGTIYRKFCQVIENWQDKIVASQYKKIGIELSADYINQLEKCINEDLIEFKKDAKKQYDVHQNGELVKAGNDRVYTRMDKKYSGIMDRIYIEFLRAGWTESEQSMNKPDKNNDSLRKLMEIYEAIKY